MPNRRSSDVIAKLKTKEWLTGEYHFKTKSEQEIANENGFSKSSVSKYIGIHGIERRKPNETYLLRREDDGFYFDNLDIIIGSILGDAGIYKNPDSHLPWFAKTNLGYDHILYVAEKLFKFNVVDRISPHAEKYWHITSQGRSDLISLHEKWYKLVGDQRIKIVPEDLVLTPTVLLHWFLDDGSTTRLKNKRKDGYRENRVVIRLASHCFTKEENEFLAERLKDNLGIDAYVTKVIENRERLSQGNVYYQIIIRQQSNVKFFETIGPCPPEIPSMFYKWKDVESYEPKHKNLMDRDWLYNELVVLKKHPTQIAQEQSAAERYVRYRAKKFGIEFQRYHEFFATIDNKEWLRTKYEVEKLKIKQIADIAGVCCKTISDRLHDFHIEKRKRNLSLPDKDWFFAKYITENLSTTMIGKLLNCDSTTIRKKLISCGIPTRPRIRRN